MPDNDLSAQIQYHPAFVNSLEIPLWDYLDQIVKNKDSELGDIYFQAWIQAEKVERELQKVINDGRNICNEIDRSLGIQTVNDLSSMYTGMLMPSQHGIKYVSAWQRFNKRKNKG